MNRCVKIDMQFLCLRILYELKFIVHPVTHEIHLSFLEYRDDHYVN